jgi:hypothetical protein
MLYRHQNRHRPLALRFRHPTPHAPKIQRKALASDPIPRAYRL